jgi:hypothetical protein
MYTVLVDEIVGTIATPRDWPFSGLNTRKDVYNKRNLWPKKE